MALNVFMSKIAVRISNKWKQLTVQVRVPESQIESIDQRYRENPSLMIAIEKCLASGVHMQAVIVHSPEMELANKIEDELNAHNN